MPLDWETVKQRYSAEVTLTTSTTSRALWIEEVDDTQVTVRTSMWTKAVLREHLEEAVRLIESGELEGRVDSFVEEYGKHVTKERRTLAARVLEDLGYLSAGRREKE